MTTFIPIPVHFPVHTSGSLPFGLFLILVGLVCAVWAIGIYNLFK